MAKPTLWMTWAVPENPDGAVGFQDPLRGGEPGAVEFVVGRRGSGFVPIAFVDGDHFAGVAGDAAVGEEVGRVGEDEVDGTFGDGGEDFQAVALVEAEVVFWDRRRRGRAGAQLWRCRWANWEWVWTWGMGRKAGPSSHCKKRNARSG